MRSKLWLAAMLAGAVAAPIGAASSDDAAGLEHATGCPGAAHGGDVDVQGNGVVSEQRLYQLIRQPGPIGERQLEIEFLDAGVEAFVFTFG